MEIIGMGDNMVGILDRIGPNRDGNLQVIEMDVVERVIEASEDVVRCNWCLEDLR